MTGDAFNSNQWILKKKLNMVKFPVNDFLHEENWERELFGIKSVPKISPHLNKLSPKVSNNIMKSHFPERRNYIC